MESRAVRGSDLPRPMTVGYRGNQIDNEENRYGEEAGSSTRRISD